MLKCEIWWSQKKIVNLKAFMEQKRCTTFFDFKSDKNKSLSPVWMIQIIITIPYFRLSLIPPTAE